MRYLVLERDERRLPDEGPWVIAECVDEIAAEHFAVEDPRIEILRYDVARAMYPASVRAWEGRDDATHSAWRAVFNAEWEVEEAAGDSE